MVYIRALPVLESVCQLLPYSLCVSFVGRILSQAKDRARIVIGRQNFAYLYIVNHNICIF